MYIAAREQKEKNQFPGAAQPFHGMAHGGRIHVGDQGQKNADNGVGFDAHQQGETHALDADGKDAPLGQNRARGGPGRHAPEKENKEVYCRQPSQQGQQRRTGNRQQNRPQARPSQQAVRFCKRARHTAVSAASARAHARVKGLEGRRSDKGLVEHDAFFVCEFSIKVACRDWYPPLAAPRRMFSVRTAKAVRTDR